MTDRQTVCNVIDVSRHLTMPGSWYGRAEQGRHLTIWAAGQSSAHFLAAASTQ